MVLDADGVRTAVGVLAVTAVFATVLVLVASAPLGRDARRLEETVRGIEAGDRSARTGVQRADELGHVGRALDELTERLDVLERERARLDEERRAMFSNIGHDLRTPLSALRAAVEALADGVAPDPDRYLRSMQRDVEALVGAGRRPVPPGAHRGRPSRPASASRSTSPSSSTRPSRR